MWQAAGNPFEQGSLNTSAHNNVFEQGQGPAILLAGGFEDIAQVVVGSLRKGVEDTFASCMSLSTLRPHKDKGVEKGNTPRAPGQSIPGVRGH